MGQMARGSTGVTVFQNGALANPIEIGVSGFAVVSLSVLDSSELAQPVYFFWGLTEK